MIILDQHILAGYLGRYECEHDVTGKSLESCHIAADGGQYLCYDCLKKAKRPAKVQPPRGVLDHRTFERAKVELGRCDVCGAGRAVYRSREARANICEGCYARLVREWNRGEGVR